MLCGSTPRRLTFARPFRLALQSLPPPPQLEPVARPLTTALARPTSETPGPAPVRDEIRVGRLVVLRIRMVEQGRGAPWPPLSLRGAGASWADSVEP